MRCPTCKKVLPAATADAERPFGPFCSQRCKLADLHGWLNDRYVVSESLAIDDSEGQPALDDE